MVALVLLLWHGHNQGGVILLQGLRLPVGGVNHRVKSPYRKVRVRHKRKKCSYHKSSTCASMLLLAYNSCMRAWRL